MSIWTDVRELFFPRLCPACGRKLLLSEKTVCFSCMSALPFTRSLELPENEMEKNFWGLFPIERAYSLFYYSRGGRISQILASMKYYGRKDLCFHMGALLAERLLPSGFFTGVDCLIPVPLHPKRIRKRGYNQSEWLAKGIVSKAGKTLVTDALYRLKDNQAQAHKQAYERWANAAGLFALTPEAEKLKGKHVVIVDDVLTTGATVEACANALSGIEGIRISVVTLAWTK